MENIKKIAGIIGLIILGLVSLFLTLTNFEAFTSFGVAMLLIGISLGIFYVIDNYILHLNTLEEIKKGNIAYGLYVIAYSIIVGSAILSSFVVMK